MDKNLTLKKNEEFDLLTDAFNTFTQATKKLRESYQNLKNQVAILNKELARTNEKLTQKIEELNKTKKYLNNILDSMVEGVIAIDSNERISIFNHSAEILTNRKVERVLGMPLSEVLKKKNEPFVFILRKTLKEGKSFIGQKEFYLDKDKVISLEVTTSLIKNEKEGRVEGALMVFRDISPLRKLKEKIEHQNRLVILGEMAATVAHEIRNPLSGIEGFALLLKNSLKNGKEREWVNHIVKGTRNLNSIVNNLLNFAHPLRPSFQEVEVRKVMEAIFPFIFEKIREKKLQIHIHKYFPSEPIKIYADPDLLKQCFLNLMLNAVQSISKKGEISITIEKNFPSYRTPCKLLREWKGNYFISNSCGDVYIKVSDTGCGIPPEDKKKIFSPFYTTKPEGTGLGLAITQKIIESHGGDIEVESTVNKGTIFMVRLPLNHLQD